MNSSDSTHRVPAGAGADPIAETRDWVDKAVIGLNLCPFAKAVQIKGQVRYVLSEATDNTGLLLELERELQHLSSVDPDQTDTTLIVHPQLLPDFLDFNDFLDEADALLQGLGLEGVLQIASFHPHYQFAGTEPGDITNFTNRSPHPTLHLLREASIDRAVEVFPDAEEIYERNVETMQRLGLDGWDALFPNHR
jgi:uncharacterized protein